MDQILTTFGIDWRLLAIQAFNFGLVLLALWYFLYRPILRMIDARQKKIAEGVKNAERAETLRQETEREKGGIIIAATKEGEGIVERARKAGAENEKKALLQAEMKAAQIATDAQREAQELKVRTLAESKGEIARMVVLGVEKVLAEGK